MPTGIPDFTDPRASQLDLISRLRIDGTAAHLDDKGESFVYAYVDKSHKWEKSDMPIKVCWEDTATDTTAKGWVLQAIAASWQHESGAQFGGWGPCSDGTARVRVAVQDSFDTGPRTDHLGKDRSGAPSRVTLNFTFEHWSQDCKRDRQFCIQTIATHEFGHVLSFAHEQNRPEPPPNVRCNEPAQGSNGVEVIGGWDDASVMNYCNANWSGHGQLSRTDIAAAVELYGLPGK